MLTKILVPLDGSVLAEAILMQVRRLLIRQDAEALLVRVVPEGAPEGEIERAREALEARKGLLAGEGARAEARLLRGDAAERILALAEEYRPSLIALSTHGRAGLARFIRGSVAERVLRRSRFPLLLLNPFGLASAGTEARFRRILVPLDGSPGSREVLPLVGEIVKLYGSEVILFRALETATTETWNEAEVFLESCRPLLGDPRTQVRIVSGGPPAVAILDAAEKEKADLVALTTHGRSGISRWLYGSVAEHVLRNHAGPLLVQRIGAPDADRARAEAEQARRVAEAR